MAEATEQKRKALEPTLAEYIEARLIENGEVLYLYYGFRCSVCELDFTFNVEQKTHLFDGGKNNGE